MRSFVIKTYFDLFNIVLESFPRFYNVCIKCIETEVLNLLNLGCLERKKKELEVQQRPREATARWPVWVATKVFSVVTELFGSVSRHRPLCCDMVPRLQAVSGLR